MDIKTAETSLREISLDDAIQTFVEIDMQFRSPQTIAWYRKKFKALQTDLGNKLLADLLTSDLLGWQARLSARTDLSIYTIHGYIRAVRRLFRWLFERGILPVNLAADLRLPKLPRHGRSGVTDRDAAAILEAAQAHPRDFAIVTFIESTSARRAGVAGLKLADLDLDAPEPLCRRVRVVEKGDKGRTVSMSKIAYNAMRHWLELRWSDSEFVFCDQRPGRTNNALSPDAISQVFKRYKKTLGITGRVSPHEWRHRWCRRLLQRGMSLGMVSQAAGHKSVTVTNDFYGTFATEEILDAVDRYYAPPVVKPSKGEKTIEKPG
jgi:site-specific recombinase XerD